MLYLFPSFLPLLCSIKFAVARGKEGVIEFTCGAELRVVKSKGGVLAVVSLTMEVAG